MFYSNWDHSWEHHFSVNNVIFLSHQSMTWTNIKLHWSILFHPHTYTLYFELAHTWKQKHKCAPMENYDNRKTANDKNWFGLLNINPRTWLNIVHILSTKIKETNNGSKKVFWITRHYWIRFLSTYFLSDLYFLNN